MWATLGIAILLALFGCFDATPVDAPATDPAESIDRRAAGDRPDIAIIVLDTVRRDRLSSYGYSRKTSPFLDALAANSTLFSEAYSTSCWTAPAHASLFTGLYPASHGSTQESWNLSEDLLTIAEVLSASGYETMAVTGNPVISRKRGFGQGFERYLESWRMAARSELPRDEVTVRLVADMLSKRDIERPLLLFVNLIGAHAPYDSCGQSCGAFGAEPSEGVHDNFWREFYRGQRNFTPEELTRLNDLYDAEIREVDRNLGRILRVLRGQSQNLFVAVTSDHGENIGEHGHMNHVFSLHETTIQVPLIVSYPARFPRGGVDRAPTQLVDLFPTIATLAGAPADAVQGVPLFESREGRPILTEYYLPMQALGQVLETATPAQKARLSQYRRRIKSYATDGWKLHWGDDSRSELYHLAEDPDEEQNLIDAPGQEARSARLRDELEEQIAQYESERSPQEPMMEVEVDEKTRSELEALGYFEK